MEITVRQIHSLDTFFVFWSFTLKYLKVAVLTLIAFYLETYFPVDNFLFLNKHI